MALNIEDDARAVSMATAMGPSLPDTDAQPVRVSIVP
jgi:hypothetical protein